jgi:monothiol glutaredoxin
MPRPLFDDTKVHPAIREKIAGFHPEMIEEATRAIAAHPVVVIGMKQNPFPKRAKKALAAHGTPFHYLEYGSYLGDYRRRLALKMWTGWSTFPMIFVKGTFIGGAEDLTGLLASGEFDTLLAA